MTTYRSATAGRDLIACLAVLAVSGCRSNALPPSLWPPEDFRLRVLEIESTEEGPIHRSFQVWADGLALYREADTVLEGLPEVLPIYRTVAAYMLDDRTTRTLARELQRAGLFAATEPIDENREILGTDASIAWWAHGTRGFVSRRQLDRGPLERALDIVDAYLPPSRAFTPAPPDVVRVDEVPEPLAYTRGALDAHVEILRSRPMGADFLREVFALAVAAGDHAMARDALTEIEQAGPEGAGGEPLDPADWERVELEPLRRVLRELSDGLPHPQ